MIRKPGIHRAFFVVSLFIFFFLSVGPKSIQAKGRNPFYQVKTPDAGWKLRKVSASEIEVFLKSKPKAVNVGLRIMEGIPIESQNFLDQVRSKGMEDPDAKGAEFGLVRTQEVGGKVWNCFIMKRKDEISQEFWTRKLSSDEVLMVLYTAVGTYYDQYHSEFMKVLEQATKD
jgi:hypothetical protein